MIPNYSRPKFNPQPKPERRQPKPPKPIAKVSPRKKKEIQDSKGEDDLPEWFLERRKELTGFCKCGCGQRSQKHSDQHYKGSCCHILPKAVFLSVRTHPLNFIEMAMFGGCHDNFDKGGMGKWPGMECWSEIKHKVLLMDPCLTEEEKGKKFYQQLHQLILNN